MRSILFIISVLLALPSAASAEIPCVKANGGVVAVMNALEVAVSGAGATVFARGDHAAGADSAGMVLGRRSF